MIGYVTAFGERYFGPRYFGRRYWAFPVAARDDLSVMAPAVQRLVTVEGEAREAGQVEVGREVYVEAQERSATVAALVRSVTAHEADREVN